MGWISVDVFHFVGVETNVCLIRQNTLLFIDPAGDHAAQCVLYTIVCANPGVKEQVLVDLCRQIRGMQHVTLSWVQQTISRVWRWTWRKPDRVSKNRFRPDNIQRWARYVQQIQFVDWRRLKFFDESHCVSKNLLSAKICGPRGANLRVFDEFPDATRLNVLLLTSIEHGNAPLFYTINSGTNNAWSFLQFVIDAVYAGYVVNGDILVMDNASIHKSTRMCVHLDRVVALVGAHIVYLPAYAPELNPCEFVFGHMKHSLKWNPQPITPLPQRLVQALREVSVGNVLSFYKNCTSVLYKAEKGDL